MKVIGAGFGRTGTMSLKAALEKLGFGPCYHMTELFKHPSHGKFWERAARRDTVDWREIFRDYGSAVDWPACSFYGELMEEYPEAKVILTVRDPVRWHESTMKTIYNASNPESGSPFFRLVGIFVPRMKKTGRMVNELIWRGTFDGRFEERGYAISVFERRTEEVKANVPSGRLLVYDVKEGWGPLCEFLGAPVPDEPFPRLNDARTFRRMISAGRIFAVASPILLALIAALTLRRLSRRRQPLVGSRRLRPPRAEVRRSIR